MTGTDHPAGRMSLQRWVAVALVATLVGLTLAAVLGSLRQEAILRSVAAESARTDAYQRAVHLATEQELLLQAALREPGGEERGSLTSLSASALAALEALSGTDPGQTARNARMAQAERALQPAVARYLTLLDAGDEAGAQEVLEDEIEPVTTRTRADLVAEQDAQIARYTAVLARAEQDSRRLLFSTVLIFVVGLGVLGLVGQAGRARRRAFERMNAQDRLTGLPNRAAFQARADEVMTGLPTVLLLDLDGFKEVNDNLGHRAGDLLLIEVGERLRRSVRGQDLVARFGGDEFAIILTDTDPAVGEASATRIGNLFHEPFVIDGITLDIEVSIGIATGRPGDNTAALLRAANTAMHTAKQDRAGFARFDPARAHGSATRLGLLGDLRRALDHDDEIEVYFQPKVSVRSGEVTGAEALARWQHPARGFVGPADFIPVLEGTSLIHRFTARVLDLALAEARGWLDDGYRVPVAVNVSTRCLLDPDFPKVVQAALRAAGLPGDLLCIEITENSVMADPDRAIAVLREIRELGVATSIDDFGTGYSSMAYLRLLPVDEIKVDRSFVADMAVDRSNHVLVASTVDLGHNLGLEVVAEGVEDEATVAALRELGCDTAQGYLFARPLPAGEFRAHLAGHAAARLTA